MREREREIIFNIFIERNFLRTYQEKFRYLLPDLDLKKRIGT
jgi:hypothetical protein